MNLTGNTFTSNLAASYQDAHGGAIYCEGGGEIALAGDIFTANRAVSVHSSYIVEALAKLYDADPLAAELGK